MLNEYLKGFNKYICYMLIFFIIVLICPILLNRIAYAADFSKIATIGDAIGGITGTFVAIAAAILTFLAFWVQFIANTLQRGDIQTERFENNLFNYFQLLNNQLSDSFIPNVGNNKQSYHFMFYEYKSICFYLQNHPLAESKDKREVFQCAFNIFINGASRSDTKRIKEDNKKTNNKHFDDDDLIEINNFFITRFGEDAEKGEVQYLRDYKTQHIKLFDGHRLYLIPFYRSICIIIKYMHEEIYGNNHIKREEKDHKFEFYLNLLCSQLSEHQIGLLKIMYSFCCEKDHRYFVDNNGVKQFFDNYIQNYINATTLDCEQWDFRPARV